MPSTLSLPEIAQMLKCPGSRLLPFRQGRREHKEARKRLHRRVCSGGGAEQTPDSQAEANATLLGAFAIPSSTESNH